MEKYDLLLLDGEVVRPRRGPWSVEAFANIPAFLRKGGVPEGHVLLWPDAAQACVSFTFLLFQPSDPPRLVSAWAPLRSVRTRQNSFDPWAAKAAPWPAAPQLGRRGGPSDTDLPPVAEEPSAAEDQEPSDGDAARLSQLAARLRADMSYHAEVFGQMLGAVVRAVHDPLPVHRLGEGLQRALAGMEDTMAAIMAKPMPFWVPVVLREARHALRQELMLVPLFQRLQDHGAGPVGRTWQGWHRQAAAFGTGFRRVVMRTKCLLELLVLGHMCTATGNCVINDACRAEAPGLRAAPRALHVACRRSRRSSGPAAGTLPADDLRAGARGPGPHQRLPR